MSAPKLWDYTEIADMSPGLSPDLVDLSPATLVKQHYANAKADQDRIVASPLGDPHVG